MIKIACKNNLPKFISVFLTLFVFVCAFILQVKAQNFFDVTNYDAEIATDLVGKSVTGKVSVRFNSLSENLSEITLNAGVLEIDSVQAKLVKLEFERNENLMKVRLAKPLKFGESSEIEIVYHGAPKYGINFLPEQNQIYTIFSTSQWLPCVDAPDDRASFRLNLIAPKNVKVIANGEMFGERELENEKISSRWEQTNSIPTYLFGFAFGEFQELTEKENQLTFRYLFDKSFSIEQAEKIFADTKDMRRFFERKSGVKYPYKTYTQVLTNGNAQQEADGFSLLNAEYGRGVLKDETDIWLGTHEFSHQWWGNKVTNKNWTHFWLNEGIANFMTAAYFEHRFGREKYLSEIERYKISYEKIRDAGKDKSLVFPDWNKPTREDRRLVYDKGAYVVHLLRLELGEKKFWKGFKDYTRKFFGKSVETKDFQTTLEKSSGRNLDKFFDKWVYLKTK